MKYSIAEKIELLVKFRNEKEKTFDYHSSSAGYRACVNDKRFDRETMQRIYDGLTDSYKMEIECLEEIIQMLKGLEDNATD